MDDFNGFSDPGYSYLSTRKIIFESKHNTAMTMCVDDSFKAWDKLVMAGQYVHRTARCPCVCRQRYPL